MKQIIIAATVLACLTASAQLGVNNIAKQRARDAANQENNRIQGVPPPAPANPATPAAPAVRPAPAPLTPAQQAFVRVQNDFMVLSTNSPAGDSKQLANDLSALDQSANKPSPATLGKLAEHLAAALSEKKLSPAQRTRLAQDVSAILNGANVSAAQKQAIIKDAQNILQVSGNDSKAPLAVAEDLQSIMEEVQKSAAK